MDYYIWLRQHTISNVMSYLRRVETENPDFPLYDSADLLTMVIDEMPSTSAQALCRESIKDELVDALLMDRKDLEELRVQKIKEKEAAIEQATMSCVEGMNMVHLADNRIERQERNINAAERQKEISKQQIMEADEAIRMYLQKLHDLEGKVEQSLE